MVRYQRKDEPAGTNDSSFVDVSKSSIGAKTARKSLGVEGSRDARFKSANLRPQHVIWLNSLTCNVELQNTKLQKDNLAASWNNETSQYGSKQIQDPVPYHQYEEMSWFKDSAGNENEIMMVNSLQTNSGENQQEIKDSCKDPDTVTSAGELNLEITSSPGSPETSDINARSRRDPDSFRHECSMEKVSCPINCRNNALNSKYPLVSWKSESEQFHLLEHEAAALNHERKLEPMKDFAEDNVQVSNDNSTQKDSSINVTLLAHERISISSFEDQSAKYKAPIYSNTAVLKFAREPRFLNIKLTDSPTVAEIEEFFLEDEKQLQRNFMARYNYDPVNDVPLTGRFYWEQLQR